MNPGPTSIVALRSALSASPKTLENLSAVLDALHTEILARPPAPEWDALRWILARGWEDLEIPFALALQTDPPKLLDGHYSWDWIERMVKGLGGAVDLWLNGASRSVEPPLTFSESLDQATADCSATAQGALRVRSLIAEAFDHLPAQGYVGERWVLVHVLDELDFVGLQVDDSDETLPGEAVRQLLFAVRAVRFAFLNER